MPERGRSTVFGWDVGGAHVKAARLHGGQVVDCAQWPCRLWLGLSELEAALAAAADRWPDLTDAAHAHALTMTGEMVDLFEHREAGVAQIAERMARAVGPLRVFAADGGWLPAHDAAAAWHHVASANWLATALHCALDARADSGLLMDVGSTTTDIVAFAGGRVATRSRSDFDRLRRGELVYQGVVRTPLCALARRVPWRGESVNVMNEFFATTADVYRTTGELEPAHDQQPPADGAGKDGPATQARLARMIGLDGRDGSDQDWLDLARAWRAAQCDELRDHFWRVARSQGLDGGTVVAAGCGAFLVPEVAGPRWRVLSYGRDVLRAPPALAGWADVSAPAAAVAALHAREVA